jgi:D-arabinose 1-dehydrogenase-like Zn-dependent alcohol dehydrogenase
MYEELVKIFKEHDLHPMIAKEFDFKDAPKAFEAMEKGDAVGKLVIKIN